MRFGRDLGVLALLTATSFGLACAGPGASAGKTEAPGASAGEPSAPTSGSSSPGARVSMAGDQPPMKGTCRISDDVGSGPVATLFARRAAYFLPVARASETTVLAGENQRSLTLWSLDPPKRIATVDEQAHALAVSTSGNLVAAVAPGGDAEVERQGLRLYDAKTLHKLGSTGPCYDAVAISPDDKLVACSNGWDGISVYSLPQLTLVTRLKAGNQDRVNALVFVPGRASPTLAAAYGAGGVDPAIRIWSVKSGTVAMSLEGHREMVNALAVSPDGSFLVSGAGTESAGWARIDISVRVWSLKDGKALYQVRHGAPVRAVAVSPSGHFFASGSDDGTVCVWNLADGSLKAGLGDEALRKRNRPVNVWAAGLSSVEGGSLNVLERDATWYESLSFMSDEKLLSGSDHFFAVWTP